MRFSVCVENMASLILLTISMAVQELRAAGYCEETYGYHGSPNGLKKWPVPFPACGGDKQSPNETQTKKVRKERYISKLNFIGYDSLINQADVLNTGFAVTIIPRDNIRRGITVEDKEYIFEQVHFHILYRRRFDLEAHFVHMSSDNRTAVVSLFVEAVKKENIAFKPIVEVLPNVPYQNDVTTLRFALNLTELLPECPASYYGYTGSLIAPICADEITWFVLKRIQTIGRRQLNSFMKIYLSGQEDRSRECLLQPDTRPMPNPYGRIIQVSP